MERISESRLRALLEAEIEELRDAGGFASGRLAKDYLIEWADAEHAYLHRFQPADSDEPAYELTPEVERVFQWLETLKPRPHVGTESKFKSLAGTLAEIVENSTREPDVRIQRLRSEQARIQQQIEEIERTGVVPVYNVPENSCDAPPCSGAPEPPAHIARGIPPPSPGLPTRNGRNAN